jgi:hypothetical protein
LHRGEHPEHLLLLRGEVDLFLHILFL